MGIPKNGVLSVGNKKADALQRDVAAFWDAEPCDSENSTLSLSSKEYYSEIEADRYAHQSHIPEVMDWLDWRGKVLEIGTGVGTDARHLIARGAEYHGINVDSGSCEATRRALDVFGLKGDVRTMSATDIRYGTDTFDAVYTYGVLHHIPDVQKAIAEIQRVLKPGGHLLFMVYNRSSINYQIEIRRLRRYALRMLTIPGLVPLFGALGFPRAKLERHIQLYRTVGRMSDSEWLSRNTDGPDNPFSRVYGSEQVAQLLGGGFQILKNEVYYFDWRHWGVLGRVLPSPIVRWLGRRWGWHRIVLARRTGASDSCA